MESQVKWVKNESIKRGIAGIGLKHFNVAEIEKARRFHQTIPQHRETPFYHLENLSKRLGVRQVFLKDESLRFGLNSFKVLGASYAVAKKIAQQINMDIGRIDFSQLKSKEFKEKFPDLVFAAATDGNHGKGVAWLANELQYPAVIHMPKGTSRERYNKIVELGGKGVITDDNYDDTVKHLAELAYDNHWLMIQDTQCLGCLEVPIWIMQGYGTMALEVMEQLGGEVPTHIFLQAGVGAFASVMTVVFKMLFPENPPVVIIVEPNKADCFYRSVAQGRKTCITGNMDSIMAGLCCGEPNPVAWDILREYADCFFSVPDWIAANGMRVLGNPLQGDLSIISGESGAVAIGLLDYLARDPKLMAGLGLDAKSKILAFSTEGDTDQEIYRSITWYGAYRDEREV